VASTPPAQVLPRRTIKLSPTQVSVAIKVQDLVYGLTTVAPLTTDAPYRSLQAATASTMLALKPDDVASGRIREIRAIPATGGKTYTAGKDLRLALEINKVYRIEVEFVTPDGENRLLATLYKAPIEKKGKQGDIDLPVTPATTLAVAAVLQARGDKVASLDIQAFDAVATKVLAVIEANRQNPSFASSIQYANLASAEGLGEVLSEAKSGSPTPVSTGSGPDLLKDFQAAVEEAARKDDTSNSLEPVGKVLEVEVPNEGQSDEEARRQAEQQAGDQVDQNRGGQVEDAVDEDDQVEVPVPPTPRPTAPPLTDLPTPVPSTAPSSGSGSGEAGSPVVIVPTPPPPGSNDLWLQVTPGDLFEPLRDGALRPGYPSTAQILLKRGDGPVAERFDFVVRGPSPEFVQVVRGSRLVVYPGVRSGPYMLVAYRLLPDGQLAERAYTTFTVRAGWSGGVTIEDPDPEASLPPLPDRQPWTGTVIIGDEPEVTK
jgi:hypothetical protein